MALRGEREAQEYIEETIEGIDDQINSINERLRKYDGLIEKRDRLQAARRALLGGVRAGTGSGGSRLRGEDVTEALRAHPGSTSTELSELAPALSGKEAAVRAHLNRGKDERYLQKGKRWWVRDPKNGVNTVDDIEED